MNKTTIIGCGEIGKSLGSVLASCYDIQYDDIKPDLKQPMFWQTEVINICYPYSESFIEDTRVYIKKYNPKLTIIHSTVPVGTTRKLGEGVVHSPVNGKHPNLSESILTFVKFVGGIRGEDVYLATKFLKEAKIKVAQFASPEATELGKMLCTTYYSWNIVFMKEVEKLCQQYNLPFHEVYTLWNKAYNQGYEKLGSYQFIRPILEPMKGEIGGHCCINNCNLLNSSLTNLVKEFNETYKEKKDDLPPRKKRNSNRTNRR